MPSALLLTYSSILILGHPGVRELGACLLLSGTSNGGSGLCRVRRGTQLSRGSCHVEICAGEHVDDRGHPGPKLVRHLGGHVEVLQGIVEACRLGIDDLGNSLVERILGHVGKLAYRVVTEDRLEQSLGDDR